MMLEDGKRMKEIGLDKWVEEQEAHRESQLLGICLA